MKKPKSNITRKWLTLWGVSVGKACRFNNNISIKSKKA